MSYDPDPGPYYEEPPKEGEVTVTEVTSGPIIGPDPSPPLSIVLTDEQAEAISRIKNWLKSPSVPDFKLGGYAGTGKTTIIKYLRKEVERDLSSVVCAFTGKAVNVLSRKGISGSTIHSLIYDCENIKGVLTWHKKATLKEDPDFIIVDESSMINKELLADLRSYGIKLLFVGDPGQLEPVGDNPNLMANPDFVLSKIHRQAEKSPIIAYANQVRTTGEVNYLRNPDLSITTVIPGELFIRNKSIKTSDMAECSQLICATNKTRQGLNEKFRLYKQLEPKKITVGEKIIVLQNNREFSIFNGVILFVKEILEDKSDHWLVNAEDEIGGKFQELPIWKRPFEQPELFIKKPKDLVVPKYSRDGRPVYKGPSLVYADYAYAITCHKSQGSEWESVIVFDQWLPPEVWDMNRWRYTAITRAAKQLTYCL